MKKPQKVERGTLYLAGPNAKAIAVRPVNGKKFTLEEWQTAVGGFVEQMIPAVRFAKVFVNEEGGIKHLPDNGHTWTFANRAVYALNGYELGWRVAGNALKIITAPLEAFLIGDDKRVTVKEAVA